MIGIAGVAVSEEEASLACCPVCNDRQNVSFQFDRNGYHIHLCRECNVEFAFPQPTDTELASIYTSSYFLGSESESAARQVAQMKRATAKLYLDAIAQFIDVQRPRLLELGCGSGDFLVEAQHRGFGAEGLEYSEHAAQVANSRLGRNAVLVGSVDTADLPSQGYDVVAGFDVIEHVRSPKHSVRSIYSLLKPRGIVAIVTPSLDSWSRRVLGRHWMEYKPEHITYLSRKSLRRLLEGAGFMEFHFVPNYKVLTFDYIVRHFDRFPVPVVSPLLRMIRKLLPAALANRSFRIVASGTMAIARRG